MTFELGKTYLVDVTEKGIIPREVFDRDRWYDKDHDDLDFLTDEEKIVVINDVLDKIRVEIEQVKSIMNEEIINHNRKDLVNFVNGLNQSLVIIDKYKAESEETE